MLCCFSKAVPAFQLSASPCCSNEQSLPPIGPVVITAAFKKAENVFERKLPLHSFNYIYFLCTNNKTVQLNSCPSISLICV